MKKSRIYFLAALCSILYSGRQIVKGGSHRLITICHGANTICREVIDICNGANTICHPAIAPCLGANTICRGVNTILLPLITICHEANTICNLLNAICHRANTICRGAITPLHFFNYFPGGKCLVKVNNDNAFEGNGKGIIVFCDLPKPDV